MCAIEFQDERSQILFILSYMKGGTTGPWATQRINAVLYDNDSTLQTFDEFTAELDSMFADPNQQGMACQRLAVTCQGSSSVDKLIQEFELQGPLLGPGDVRLVDCFEQVLNPCL